MFPRKVYKEWTCPINSNTFLFPTICILFFVHFANEKDGGDSRVLAKVLFWAAAPLQLLICVCILSQWMYYLRHEDHDEDRDMPNPVALPAFHLRLYVSSL